jgi:hypothetical protein
VRSENGVVWFNNGGGDLRSGIHAELKLALLAIVDGQTLHQQGTETRTGSTTKGVEDQETLQTRAIVGNTSNLVQDLINKLLSDSVVATSIVVRRVLLSSNHLFWVEKTAVGSRADLVNDVWLEIAVDGSGNIFSLAWMGVSED